MVVLAVDAGAGATAQQKCQVPLPLALERTRLHFHYRRCAHPLRSFAEHKLEESGIESETLQRHLRREEQPDHGEMRLYVLDESSLGSTKQMNEFLHRLHGEDRVRWWVTRASMKPSKQAVPIRSCKTRESK